MSWLKYELVYCTMVGLTLILKINTSLKEISQPIMHELSTHFISVVGSGYIVLPLIRKDFPANNA